MICHFQGGGRAAPLAPQRPPDPTPDPTPDPLAPVLAGLIGREVTLLAGSSLHAGRLLRSVPVTLVDQTGRVTIIAAMVVSVQF